MQRIGWRTWKTVISVYIFFIDTERKSGIPFYAAIAAILCIQKNRLESLKVAKKREIATLIGGSFGMLYLILERYVNCQVNELLRELILSLLLIPLIHFAVLIKQESGTFLMCVVFLCVTVTHGDDISPVWFALNRIIDTTIGIGVSLLVNILLPSNTTDDTEKC